MANDLAKNPYKVDTAMANTLRNTAGARFTPGPITIQKILWVSPVTIADTYNIDSDIAGSIVDRGTCDTAKRDLDHNFIPGQEIFDFKVTQISSGTLYIFFE